MIATGVQLKAARELLGWSQRDLAERVAFGPGGHPSTVKYWERPPAIPTGQREPVAVRNFRHAFEAAGADNFEADYAVFIVLNWCTVVRVDIAVGP